VVNVISDSNIGGAGVALLNYLGRADTDSFRHIAAVPEGSMLLPGLRERGVETCELRVRGDRSWSASAVSEYIGLFRRLRPDIVHTHACLSARLAARIYGGARIVCTRHSAFPPGRLETAFPARQVKGAVNSALADAVIAISPATRDNLVDTGMPSRKIFVMLNGVEPVRRMDASERAEVRAGLGIGPDEFVCTVIARLEDVKGHRYILEAAKLLEGRPIRFVIAGAGSAENRLREMSRALGLRSCVFTGFVADTSGIENISDLQLNASYGTEASSMSLIEGMSLGVPAVASDYGGNPYHVADGETGLLVPEKDSRAIAEAIRSLHGDPERLGRMSRRAREEYERRFTAARMARDIESVYRAVLARSALPEGEF
jgi:glycosyltransferase involved in cell wall biosynthesis